MRFRCSYAQVHHLTYCTCLNDFPRRVRVVGVQFCCRRLAWHAIFVCTSNRVYARVLLALDVISTHVCLSSRACWRYGYRPGWTGDHAVYSIARPHSSILLLRKFLLIYFVVLAVIPQSFKRFPLTQNCPWSCPRSESASDRIRMRLSLADATT